jgi:hypothetical protein
MLRPCLIRWETLKKKVQSPNPENWPIFAYQKNIFKVTRKNAGKFTKMEEKRVENGDPLNFESDELFVFSLFARSECIGYK